jgi:hypothetical protein
MQFLRNLGPSHMVAIATHHVGMLGTATRVVELGVLLAFTRARAPLRAALTGTTRTRNT